MSGGGNVWRGIGPGGGNCPGSKRRGGGGANVGTPHRQYSN